MKNEWKTIECAGREYGHVPGHDYHDVKIQVRQGKSGCVYARALEVWGSCQGYNEEHGRNVLAEARGASALSAVNGLPSVCNTDDEYTLNYYKTARSEAITELD